MSELNMNSSDLSMLSREVDIPKLDSDVDLDELDFEVFPWLSNLYGVKKIRIAMT